ncbi:MAG: hypothetical protein JW841_14935 [Deltaproteobacteria bacterium]|nr:hypothetical protein [Deltaproteobacteria bacterium]
MSLITKPVAAFDLHVTENTTGEIVIFSSASDEQSYESDEHDGALFTTHWITGLRGAADVNKDRRVTLIVFYCLLKHRQF